MRFASALFLLARLAVHLRVAAVDAAAEGGVVWGVIRRQVAVADEVVNDDDGGVLFEFVAVAHKAADFIERQAEKFADFAVVVVRLEIGR